MTGIFKKPLIHGFLQEDSDAILRLTSTKADKPRYLVLCRPKQRISKYDFESPKDWKRKHDHLYSFTRNCIKYETDFSYIYIIQKSI